MTKTENQSPLTNLVGDAIHIGPAPTRTREAAVVVVSLVLLTIIVGITTPDAVIVSVIVVVALAGFAIRWAVGTRTWGQR